MHNDFNDWLVLWLEPLGEDRWLRPGDRFRIRSTYNGDDLAFTVSLVGDSAGVAAPVRNVAVWVQLGDSYAEVTDEAGAVIECGHRRPAEVSARWATQNEEALDRLRSGTESAGS